MTTHITPTPGRIVLYRGVDREIRPAIVIQGNGPFNADLYVFPKDNADIHCGYKGTVTHADPEQEPGCFPSWHWMPYQKQQAEKHAEREVQEIPITTADKYRMRLDDIGRVCHEVNRAYCQALGDDSQPTWEDAPAWQRESARMGVDLHMSGNFGPEASHISWMNQKLADGWTYGPAKNPDLKQHPCLVPFDQLPREQQAKDYLFRAVVHALR
jgi:hypothetical protein